MSQQMNNFKNALLAVLMATCFFYSLAAADDSAEPQAYVYKSIGKTELKAYAFFPDDFNPQEKHPAIVIFHGGGWSMGEASWGFSLAKHYADKGMVGISAQYRLQQGDEVTPVESMADARSAIRWMRTEADTLGIDPNRIVAYGWSAGAHLAASAAVFNHGDNTESYSSVPNALALYSPALSLTLYKNFDQRLGGKAKTIDISPAEHIRPGLPPSIIVIGRTDTVTPLSGSQKFHDNMLKHGNTSALHVYDGVGHLFTPSDQPDDGWPKPDPVKRKQANDEIDRFLSGLGYF